VSTVPDKDNKAPDPKEVQAPKAGDSQVAKVEDKAHQAGLQEAQGADALKIIQKQAENTATAHVPGLTIVDNGKAVKPGEKSDGVMGYVNAAVAKGTEAVSAVISEAEKGIKAIGKAVGIGGEAEGDGKKTEVAAAKSGDKSQAADKAPAANAGDKTQTAGTNKVITDGGSVAIGGPITGDGRVNRDSVIFRGPTTSQPGSGAERQVATGTDATKSNPIAPENGLIKASLVTPSEIAPDAKAKEVATPRPELDATQLGPARYSDAAGATTVKSDVPIPKGEIAGLNRPQQAAAIADADLKSAVLKQPVETPRMVAPQEAPKPPAAVEAPKTPAAVEAPKTPAAVEAPKTPAAVEAPKPKTTDTPSPVVANLEATKLPQANPGDAPVVVPPAKQLEPAKDAPTAAKDATAEAKDALAAKPGEPEKEKSYYEQAKDLAGKVADGTVAAVSVATDAAISAAKAVKEFVVGPDDIKFGDEKYSKSGDKWKGADGKLYNDVAFDKDAKKLVLKGVDGSVEEHLQSGEKVITSKDANDRSNVVKLDASGKPTEVTTDGQKLQFDPNTKKWTDDTGRAVNDVTYNAANGDVSINWNGTTIQTVSRSGESNVTDAQRGFSAKYDAKGNLTEVQDKSGLYKVTEDPAKQGQPVWKDSDGNTLSQVSIYAKSGEMSIVKNDKESIKVSADGVREQVSPAGTVITSRDGSNNEISVKLGVDGKPTEMVTPSGTYIYDASKNQWSKDTIPIAGAEFNRATGEIIIRKDADNTITTKLNGEVTTLNKAAGNLKTEFDAKGEVKAISSDYIGSLKRQQDSFDSTKTTFVDDKGII